ncbi:MAG: TerB family tellurite resistance protein [Acidobacteria bacterium]|uniref:TerB family tellurite resistance protein n=1 Tax=Candidatus Polarisedimenticola svalbardensis TaxID=2886004 RepID=A0A8J6XZS5_9BACT|nr:TerB family tellurite resistance protein [Candidatus Polarisedimenticola svalbardensis]
MSILDLIGLGRGSGGGDEAATGDSATVRKIAAALEDMEPEQARYMAAFAYILGRVANADRVIHQAETATMCRLLREKGSLGETQAALVVEMARQQGVLFGASEDYLVTREFREISTKEQRLALLDCLFAVSAADRSISALEGRVLMQIADELKLDRREYTALRTTYREYLSVLQKPDED